MVVSKKRNGHKTTKKDVSSEGSTKSSWRSALSHSCEGPIHVSKFESSGPSRSFGPAEPNRLFIMGYDKQDGTQETLKGLRHMSGGSLAHEVKSRDFVRGMFLGVNPKLVAIAQILSSSSSLTPSSNHEPKSILCPTFEFLAFAITEVGHKPRRGGDRGT